MPITLKSKREKKSKFKYYFYRYRCQMLNMPVIPVGKKQLIIDAYLSSLMEDVVKGLKVSLWQNFGTVEIKEFPLIPRFKDGKLKAFIDWKKTNEEKPNFKKSNFEESNFEKSNFEKSNLEKSNLEKSDLTPQRAQ